MSSILILPLPLPLPLLFPLSQVKRNPDDIGHAFLGYQRSLGWLSGQEVSGPFIQNSINEIRHAFYYFEYFQ